MIGMNILLLISVPSLPMPLPMPLPMSVSEALCELEVMSIDNTDRPGPVEREEVGEGDGVEGDGEEGTEGGAGTGGLDVG